MISQAGKRGLILQVGHLYRYHPASLKIRGFIEEGKLGEVQYAYGHFIGFKRPRTDVGVTQTDAIHYFDLFNYLFGSPPQAVRAVVGRLQLQKLDQFNESRRQIARWYGDGLKGLPVITPKVRDWAEPVFHLYVIQTPERESLANYLKERGVQTGIHYPIPCHLQPAVKHTLGRQPKLKRTEETANKILSLPIYPELEKEKVDFVCAAIKEFFNKRDS